MKKFLANMFWISSFFWIHPWEGSLYGTVQKAEKPTDPTTATVPSSKKTFLSPQAETQKETISSVPFFLNSRQTIEATGNMRLETVLFVQLLEQFHCSGKKLKNLPVDEVLRSFAAALDGRKMIFTQEQIDWFIKEYHSSFELLWHSGSLTPGFLLTSLYQRLFQERVQWILQRLTKPFDFSSSKTFREEYKEATFLPNFSALDAKWERRLQHELLNEMMCHHHELLEEINPDASPQKSDPEETILTEEIVFKNEASARERLKERYLHQNQAIQSFEPDEIQEMYCNSLAQFYDPHTNFLSANSMEDFFAEFRNAFVGIGAVLKDEHGTCSIAEIMPESPADRCGQLHVGDKILSVAQGQKPFVEIQGMPLRRSVKLIRGEKGTTVRLLIQPVNGDPSQRKIVELVRDEIKMENKLAFAKIFSVPDAFHRYHTIGWIDIPMFYGKESENDTQTHSVSSDVRCLIEQMKTFPIEGIILDMRRNGGGLLGEAVQLAGLFLNRCPVVQIQGNGQKDALYADEQSAVWDGPLMILTSRFSASATEITAGALQFMHRALIFGSQTTHGKGSVQALLEMSKIPPLITFGTPLGGVKLTVQKWYLPDGSSIQLRGICPDITLPETVDCLPIREADLPHPLPWDCIAPMVIPTEKEHSCQWIRPEVWQFLRQQQQARKEQEPYFDWYLQQVRWFAQRYQSSEYPLCLSSRIQRSNAERKQTKALSTKEKTFLPLRYGYRKITLQGISSTARKEEKGAFDLFEQEALHLMVDWMYLLPRIPFLFPLWHAGLKRF
ncbi:MAG: carboxy terminal-processing peptidase [Opitutales bacterium]|nr:carboxy terminal-processing peptidase [Opitutales bacterium]